ncbi:hypothetical protein RJ639_017783 [Escallonia herrerae]|uniref:E3 ubiquitin-protein ligase XBAT33 n=1 Tax=Escallonia herrerae TaxID=1293975 RepID=A0AA88VDR8_9ASTE|nr:hypothetical protein RJ639_017783 [Escallonia herrerae]
MGNSFGCSASGERLVSAARDGDFVEAKMLLDCNPCLSKYSTFGGLNSPLHFAAAKGHNEIVALLLENGADVNSRNYCGQVTRADYLTGRTALHFAAVYGNVRCIRLVVGDFVPSAPFDSFNGQANADRGDTSNTKNKHDQSALAKFVNKAADGGITALHMAALNGYFDCVQLLLDLHADVSGVTFHYGTSMDLIGPPFKRCQSVDIKLQRYSSPFGDCHGNIASLENMWLSKSRCGHELCVRCALYLCSTSNLSSELLGPPGSIPCPLCRNGIVSFVKLPGSAAKETKLHMSLSLCTPCMLHPRELDRSTPACTPEIRKNRVASVSSDIFCPVTCSPFPSVAIPLCTCNDGQCQSFEPREGESQDESPHRPQPAPVDQDKLGGVRLDKTSCSSMFWGRRSCSREQQCNSEINA